MRPATQFSRTPESATFPARPCPLSLRVGESVYPIIIAVLYAASPSQIQILSATVRDQSIAGATVILQNNVDLRAQPNDAKARWDANCLELGRDSEGSRPTGSRIVAFDVDAAGIPLLVPHAQYPEYGNGGVKFSGYRPGPAAEPTVLTPGWDLKPGNRPAGAPVGLTVAEICRYAGHHHAILRRVDQHGNRQNQQPGIHPNTRLGTPAAARSGSIGPGPRPTSGIWALFAF
jgi:hypothetical protein